MNFLREFINLLIYSGMRKVLNLMNKFMRMGTEIKFNHFLFNEIKLTQNEYLPLRFQILKLF